MVGRARSEMSSGRLDGQLDRAIGKRLLGNGMTGPASFKPGLFDRIGLKKRPARRRHGDGITKFGLNLDDVANGNSP